jgi:short subunit dehydrogenase-like uncharacterized protein
MPEKPYDLIVFGATSFAGKLLCAYLLKAFPGGGLKWAAAARSRAKLEQFQAQLGEQGAAIPLLTADASDGEALAGLCAQTRAIVSTVGPYALYGEPLVKACVESGTDYCDITGEVQWMHRMLERYEAQAKASGARIVHCCGFDSIPSDMGVYFLQKHARERFGLTCPHVKMRVKAMRGGVSGGTVASLMNVAAEAAVNPDLRKKLSNPYLLSADANPPATRQASLNAPGYDEAFGAYTAPFVMAGINTRVVHRSNSLRSYAYGREFRYDEAMLTGRGTSGRLKAYGLAGGLGSFLALAAFKPSRWVLTRFIVPAPGQGPSPESQARGFYDLRFLGLGPDGSRLMVKVTGDADPGYGSTAKMLGQAAACLALQGAALERGGGFWTPSTLFGDRLLEALPDHAGVRFEMLD